MGDWVCGWVGWSVGFGWIDGWMGELDDWLDRQYNGSG